uniref:Glycosyltransferase 2-like domain-containing protein n=1 Tax=Timema bartmani TaxID=61472 RepID=A0A7R9F9J7_9NEOP|nr:unnamed protein product [Timema bartmani]
MLFRIVLCRRRNFLSKYFCYFIVILLLFFVFANQMTGQKQIGLVKQNQENEFIKLFESKKLTYLEFIEKQDHLLANRSIINSATADIVYEALIARDNLNIIPGLGEGGIPANLEDDLVSISEEVMKKEAMNLILSDKISLTRTLRDPRNPLTFVFRCKTVTYDRYLPSASVIIIFTNEALSPLLRTVHSVLNRSPPQFLHELILVDDFSDRAVLKGKLEYYVKTRFPSKVRLMRLSERSGLIRTRLAGARAATGDVLVFLDSHCEVFDSWLEPLLQRIKESRTSVLTPLIDVIDHKTLEYKLNFVDFQIGGFSWSGHFTWIPVPPEEEARRDSPIAPARSPTMAGGLLALERNFFWEIGSYDDGMDVWGGENLEMSFRVWQCGGTLETIPCSRVGHIFRSFHPYTFPGGKDTHGINTVRVAEVWMDEYKQHFYTHRPDLLGVDYGDISRRVEFRKKKKCKSFKWFLQNVYPQMFIPNENVQAFGKVSGKTSCIFF